MIFVVFIEYSIQRLEHQVFWQTFLLSVDVRQALDVDVDVAGFAIIAVSHSSLHGRLRRLFPVCCTFKGECVLLATHQMEQWIPGE